MKKIDSDEQASAVTAGKPLPSQAALTAGKPLRSHSETSEKAIERYLCGLVKEAGGYALKYSSASMTGWPDRVLLMPGGVCGWVEVKSRGKRPTALQTLRMEALRRQGFYVEVCDSREKARLIVSDLHILSEAMRDAISDF